MFDIGSSSGCERAYCTLGAGYIARRAVAHTPHRGRYCLALTSYRLDIEYDGGGFSGWAAQPGLRTVQGELEAALATILREEVALTVAGRTDAGVHAWGQVASFEVQTAAPDDLLARLNGLLPPEVAVRAAAPVEGGFDARGDARSRTYCYRVLARSAPSPLERDRALWWPHRLDVGALQACAAALVGTHDFTSFSPSDTDHVRFDREVMRAEWGEEAGGILSFWIEADAFMRNMVRVLVGTMLEVGSGKRSLDAFEGLLEGADRADAGETAPAHGLCLVAVRY